MGAQHYRLDRAAPGNRVPRPTEGAPGGAFGSISHMQGILTSAQAALMLVLVLVIGWSVVWLAGVFVERKLKGNRAPSIWSSFTWVWDNSNIIGIPMLILGTLYIVWAMNFGSGLGSETFLILMLMGAAGLLIGFAPNLRRR